MSAVSARRALDRRGVRRGSARHGAKVDPHVPPVFWGRIGAYEAVSRGGILFLLAPEPVHPSLRVKSGA